MLTRFRQIVSLIFGNFSWKPPGWLASAAGRTFLWFQAHERSSGVVALTTLALSGAGREIWHWQRHLAKTETVSFRVESPVDSSAQLGLGFAEAVAPIESDRHRPILSGIRMEPPIEGIWSWTSDRNLCFRPKIGWPNGVPYRIRLDRALFAPQVLLAGYEADIQTPKFRASFSNIEFPAVARLGEPITVTLRVRSVKAGEISNVAIVDLLPGGFEVVKDSLQPGVGSAGCDYVDVREDRTLFFRSVGEKTDEISCMIKATAPGEFVVPPIFAESMYQPGIHAVGLGGHITVLDAK